MLHTVTLTYSKQVSLAQALSADAIAVYGKRATGEKYLVCPNNDLWNTVLNAAA